MDSKFYVPLDAARLLKEKGYKRSVNRYYSENGFLHDLAYDENYDYQMSNNDLDLDHYAAPTKAEAIDWLESKGIVVVLCRVTPIYMGYAGEKDWSFDLELKESGKYDGCLRFLTRLEAEEAAIIKALELL